MKTRLLVIIIGIGIISTSGFLIPQAFGIPYFSEEQKIEVGQFIAIGKITSYHDEGIYRFYDAKIIKWLKNSLEQETVLFRSINEKGFEPHTPKAIFEVGDFAVINLRDYDRGFLESTFFSKQISEDQIESEIKRIEDLVELKIPLPLDIRKSMWNSCSSLGDGFSKEEKEFWKTLHIKLLSITPEFKSANGKLSSITIQSAISATSCPPTTTMNGTFTSVNEEMHKFQLEFDGNTFRYQIDDIFPPQYEGAMESPLKQFKFGIQFQNIICKSGLELVAKKTNGQPICIKGTSVQKLTERGYIPEYNKSREIPIITKAKQLGIDNMMEAIDSADLSYDEKKEYIKLNYEQESGNVTTLNLRMKDFPRELQDGERPTFTLIESGYANTCTAPKLEVYLIKGERGLYNYDVDKPIYEEQIVMHPCPKFEQYFPVLNYWTEEDFPSFPPCKYIGTHIIVGDSGTERHALEEYFCNGLEEYEPAVP